MRKLTISVSEEVYEGLYAKIGTGRISRFLDSLARPHVVDDELVEAYREMASDQAREADALEWVDSLVADAAGATVRRSSRRK